MNQLLPHLTWTSAAHGSVFLPFLLTFCLCLGLAMVYMWTFQGMSYTQGLVHSIVLSGLVACMLMMAIGSSLAAGIGVAGGLALVRFRTALREPRDTMFVFVALGVGIAAGLRAYGVALAGAASFAAISTLLWWTEFGAQRKVDGLLRFQLPQGQSDAAVAAILKQHTQYVALVTLREVAQGRALEHAYQVRLGQPEARQSLIHALEELPGVQGVSLMLQEPTVEL